MRWWNVRFTKPDRKDLSAPALAAATITVNAISMELAVTEALYTLKDPEAWRAVKAEELEVKSDKAVFCLEHRKVMTDGVCPVCNLE